MQRAFSLLPRLKPITAVTRTLSLAPLRSVSSMALPSAHAIPPTSMLQFASPAPASPATCSITQYMAGLKPFHPPTAPSVAPQPTMHATSVLRKRKLKMNKHKHKKLMKRTRALRKRIGK